MNGEVTTLFLVHSRAVNDTFRPPILEASFETRELATKWLTSQGYSEMLPGPIWRRSGRVAEITTSAHYHVSAEPPDEPKGPAHPELDEIKTIHSAYIQWYISGWNAYREAGTDATRKTDSGRGLGSWWDRGFGDAQQAAAKRP